MSDLEVAIDSWARRWVGSNRVPCLSIALSVGGKLLYRRDHGWANIESKVALSGDDTFYVASCAKFLTSVAAMQLYEKGQWSLDDSVAKFIPEFADVPGVSGANGEIVPLERPILMRDLLTHTAGLCPYSFVPVLRDGRPNPFPEVMGKLRAEESLEGVSRHLARLPLVHQPGTVWEYGLGIDIVGRVVEVLSGMTLDKYLEENILGPLGMDSTCFVQHLTPEIETRLAQRYKANDPAWMADPPAAAFYSDEFVGPCMVPLPDHLDHVKTHGKALNAGGGIVSSVADWLKFMECVCRGGLRADGRRRILEPSTIELMSKDHLTKAADSAEPGTVWEYGLGIDIVGRVVEVLSGMTLDKYLEVNILGPLGMNSTCFVQHMTPEIETRLAHRYAANVPAWTADPPAFHSDEFVGLRMVRLPDHLDYVKTHGKALNAGGGIVSSVAEWLKFMECLCRGGLCVDGHHRILEPSTIELMSKDHLTKACRFGPTMMMINGRMEDDLNKGFGLSVAVEKGSLGGGLFEWGGITSTMWWVDLRQKVAAVCFSHLMPSIVYPLRSELQDILAAHSDTPPAHRSKF
eukprot:CAMPEP_0204098852 /NCGR_PEP_ID=MMETSP0360-20130528/193164_1 /ASSEMBLY_ACC=CAM_ASM_000342 /TAXON_ID=268821 /ORGANISM="Scrippsiella Hangoei, Strain SHTV-5" /LENGTH=575 /DNA_ID=CAMNT_0051048223 /DNA_START=10 /DNA_END=1738 /DNA_ORIENTATION=+